MPMPNTPATDYQHLQFANAEGRKMSDPYTHMGDIAEYWKDYERLMQELGNAYNLIRDYDKTINEMRDENKLHGHITDASAHYLVNIKPRFDKLELMPSNATDQRAGELRS